MWETERLGSIVDRLTNGYVGPTRNIYRESGIPYLLAKHVKNNCLTYDKRTYISSEFNEKLKKSKLKVGDVLLVQSGHIGHSAVVPEKHIDHNCHAMIVITPQDHLLGTFLSHFFTSPEMKKKFTEIRTGSTVPHLTCKAVKELQVPLPSIEEQKRIVAILDEAFAGIDKAIENTEKNLVNAKELFESTLNDIFTQKGEGWVEERLVNLTLKIGSGATPKGGAQAYKEHGISLIRSLNVHDRFFKANKLAFIDDVQAEKLSNVIVEVGDVLFNITGASVARCCIAPSNHLPARVNQHVSILRPITTRISPQFLCYLMTSKPYKERLLGIGEEGGSTRQAITKTQLQELVIAFPDSLDLQTEIVECLNVAELKSKKLEAIYQQKLIALKELKQSLLQKAFAGELTSQDAIETAAPEYTANIIAIAFARHAKFEKEKTFGHVKTQKLLHLIEAVGEIDLGREPIKDAAGPNDLKHMKKAEEWAKENNFFEFVKRGKGYDFIKLSHFDKYLAQAQDALVEHRDIYTKIIDLLVPLNTRQAELVATVHAAWNNLLLDGKTPSDDAIIHEARENWHSDKLKIPRHEFTEALVRIRRENIMPKGTGQRVTGQEVLLL